MNLIFLLQTVQTTTSGFSFIFVLILFILLIRLFMGYESICYKLGRLLWRLKFRNYIYRYKIYKNKTRLKKINNSHPSVKYEDQLKEKRDGVVDQSSVEIDINKMPFVKKEILTYEDVDKRLEKKEEVKQEISIVKKEESPKEESDWVKEWEERVKLNNRDYGGLFKPRSKFNRDKTAKELYKDELSDSRWEEKRERILKRDGYRCCWCGEIDHLQIHHKYYSKYPDGSRAKAWDYPDDALMVLCDDCHKKYHAKYKSRVYYRKWETHYEKV